MSFKRPASSKTLLSYVKALHIKRLKCWSETLAKSLFGITRQPGPVLSVALSHGLWNVGRGFLSLQASAAGICWPETNNVYCYCLHPYFGIATTYAIDPHSALQLLNFSMPSISPQPDTCYGFCISTQGSAFERCLLILQTGRERETDLQHISWTVSFEGRRRLQVLSKCQKTFSEWFPLSEVQRHVMRLF